MIYFLDKNGLLSLLNRTLWEVNCMYYDICACNVNIVKKFNSPPLRCSNCTVRSAVRHYRPKYKNTCLFE